MEKNIWEDKNPWQKYFQNGTYNLGKMKIGGVNFLHLIKRLKNLY